MRYQGTFFNKLSQRVDVVINTLGGDGIVEIGEAGSSIFFANENPVEIADNTNDLFDTLARHQAVIRLLCRNVVKDFFSGNITDTHVSIFVDKVSVFEGFIEPQLYAQSYNDEFDMLEIACIDVLAGLQYINYGNTNSISSYQLYRHNVQFKSLKTIISDILTPLLPEACIYYDNSKNLPDATTGNIFSELEINELVFLGDNYEDVWTQEEVLSELLRYLNLHMRIESGDVYIYSRGTIGSDVIRWLDVLSGGITSQKTNKHKITADIVEGCGTTIDMYEAYSQLSLTCETMPINTLVRSPLTEDDLTPVDDLVIPILTEYYAKNWSDLSLLVRGGNPSGTQKISHYGKILMNNNWIFNGLKSSDGIDTLNEIAKSKLPHALILREKRITETFDSATDEENIVIDETDNLVITINGNGKDDFEQALPSEKNLLESMPLASYESSEGIFLHAGDSIPTSYIVISGKIKLNPLLSGFTGDFGDYNKRDWNYDYLPVSHGGFQPSIEHLDKLYKFDYSAEGNNRDEVSKVAVLACMLRIGDKVAVEVRDRGNICDYRWKKYKKLAECENEDEYYAQCINIGFNPKIGDYIIGQEYPIRNNISALLGLSEKGTAIPVRASDKVSGKVYFSILGPVNTVWKNVTRRHRTWFRREKYYSDEIPILAHVNNIYISDFEIKTVSGYKGDGYEESDITYSTDVTSDCKNIKDDLVFRISSMLTNRELLQLKISPVVGNIATCRRVNDHMGVASIYDAISGIVDKPEKLYLEEYYKQLATPTLSLLQRFHGRDIHFTDVIKHPTLSCEMMCLNINRYIDEGVTEVRLVELKSN